MKKILTIILLLSSLSGFSQANFYRFGIGLQGGITTAYTGLSYKGAMIASNPDADKKLGTNKSRTLGGSLDYYFTPFISAGVEYNMVQLTDGPDQYNRQFVADFSNIELRGNVAAGQFFDYSYNPLVYALRNINLSLGLGVISGKNNVADYTEATDPRRQHANDIGKSEYSTVLNLPTTIGYRINFFNAYNQNLFQVGVHYKMVFTFSDDIDGFNDNPAMFQNNSKDAYTTLGFSVKYLFGPTKIFYR
ncbi:hypothetical protein PBAC_14880 [Pedobacter glucosidilyticus]|nr:hypothetical protein [Pedobacter glucosidilyticus]KHJ38285.1 hypothetical protein PBAC_14880 [Pedobacter glucosidilyticus]